MGAMGQISGGERSLASVDRSAEETPHKPEHGGQNRTEHEARHDRKINPRVLAFDANVARQSAEREARRKNEEGPDQRSRDP
jgi:hypothetical protein